MKIFIIIDKIIENRLFRPAAIAIIASFVVFQGLEISKGLFLDYKDYRQSINKTSPIKINISEKDVNLDLDQDQIVEYRVRKGDTMSRILFEVGMDEEDVSSILKATKEVFRPSSLVVGDLVSVKYRLKVKYHTNNSEKYVERKVAVKDVIISPDPELEIVISKNKNNEYKAKERKVQLTTYIAKYKGVINNGLFVDGVDIGISPTPMMNLINLYSYDVDFQRDIRKGDKFEIMYKSFFNDKGKKVKDGDILFASLELSGRKFDIYMHKVRKNVEYFDEKGNSVKKSLLRTPINGARISSGFGWRKHPILGYSKLHKGTDFAARRGTPIMAAGSGVVTYRGRRGGYGKYVRIRHSSQYSTAYAHASRYAKGIRVGSRVKQGDIIAYVGTTGRSTGPHLHYEVLLRGKQINPSKVKSTSGIKLKGEKLKKFKVKRDEIDKLRKKIKNQQIILYENS